MPYVLIKCYEGRDDKMKTECAEKVAKAVSETLGCPETAVTVAIKDVKPSEWKEKVIDTCIIPDREYLYRDPDNLK